MPDTEWFIEKKKEFLYVSVLEVGKSKRAVQASSWSDGFLLLPLPMIESQKMHGCVWKRRQNSCES